MTKRVRKDLQGAVWIDGKSYFAGDKLPNDAVVGDHVAADEPPRSAPKPPRRSSAKKDD